MRMFRRRSGRLAAAVVSVAALVGVGLFSVPAASAQGPVGNAIGDYHCDPTTNNGHFNVVQLSNDTGNPYTVPSTGSLTSWSLDSGPAVDGGPTSTTAQFQVWRGSGLSYELIFQGDPVTVTAGTGVHSYDLDPPVAVESGDTIGVGLTVTDGYCVHSTQDSNDDWALNSEDVSPDNTYSFFNLPSEYECCNGTINVAAEFEPAPNLTIRKVVAGTAPNGATFTEHVSCGTFDGNEFYEDFNTDVTFDQYGNPLSDPEIAVPPGETCFVNETATGGATVVTYECNWTGELVDGAQSVSPDLRGDPGCIGNPYHAGPSLSSFFGGTVTLDGNGDSATITVQNDFPLPPPPSSVPPPTRITTPRPQPFPTTPTTQPLTPLQPAAAPAAALAVSPAFTG